MIPMQSSKTSKDGRQKAADIASAPAGKTPAKEVKKTAARSQPKNAMEPVPAAAKSHRKSASHAVETAKEAVSAPQPAVASAPAHEDIAKLAYSFWQERNFSHGHADEDWSRAVRELSRNK